MQEFFESDDAFDDLFPVQIRQLSGVHWSPLEVAKVASSFLAPEANTRVIDIGAGVGKFCIVGSHFTQGHFTGIEHQKKLVTAGNKLIRKLKLTRVQLVHTDFEDFEIQQYTGIYFYNSFYENLIADEALQEASGNDLRYETYMAIFRAQLTAMPQGTRLATYWLSAPEVPGCYMQQSAHFNDHLKLWTKIS